MSLCKFDIIVIIFCLQLYKLRGLRTNVIIVVVVVVVVVVVGISCIFGETELLLLLLLSTFIERNIGKSCKCAERGKVSASIENISITL